MFVLYHGDEVVDIGTKDELAERHGLKPDTISFYASASYLARVAATDDHVYAIRVEERE